MRARGTAVLCHVRRDLRHGSSRGRNRHATVDRRPARRRRAPGASRRLRRALRAARRRSRLPRRVPLRLRHVGDAARRARLRAAHADRGARDARGSVVRRGAVPGDRRHRHRLRRRRSTSSARWRSCSAWAPRAASSRTRSGRSAAATWRASASSPLEEYLPKLRGRAARARRAPRFTSPRAPTPAPSPGSTRPSGAPARSPRRAPTRVFVEAPESVDEMDARARGRARARAAGREHGRAGEDAAAHRRASSRAAGYRADRRAGGRRCWRRPTRCARLYACAARATAARARMTARMLRASRELNTLPRPRRADATSADVTRALAIAVRLPSCPRRHPREPPPRTPPREAPDADAFRYRDERLTLSRLGRARRSAGRRRSRRAACGRGDVVALLLPSTPLYLVAYLGAARIGAVTTGINVRYRRTEIGHVLARAGARLLLGASRAGTTPTSASMVEALDPSRPSCVWLDADRDHRRHRASVERIAAGAGGAAGRRASRPTTPVAIVFTSGTTGAPKGAWYAHREPAGAGRDRGPPASRPAGRAAKHLAAGLSFAHVGTMARIAIQIGTRGASLIHDTFDPAAVLEVDRARAPHPPRRHPDAGHHAARPPRPPAARPVARSRSCCSAARRRRPR